jgi:hypothetical protein
MRAGRGIGRAVLSIAGLPADRRPGPLSARSASSPVRVASPPLPAGFARRRIGASTVGAPIRRAPGAGRVVVSSLAVLPWPTPAIDPLVFALADATAPSCIDATLRVTDAAN